MGIGRARSFSALQRAEIAEMYTVSFNPDDFVSFSALQRAEIAEINDDDRKPKQIT